MPKCLKFDRAKARQLRDKGLTYETIGLCLGVSGAAVFYALKHGDSPHHDFLRALSPEALADYRTLRRAQIPIEEARRAVLRERSEAA